MSHKWVRVISAPGDNAQGSRLRYRTSRNKHSITQLFSLRETTTMINFRMLHYVPEQIQREHLSRWMSNRTQQNTL